eukprot:9482396-Pyramimonas_sp.AAC.1
MQPGNSTLATATFPAHSQHSHLARPVPVSHTLFRFIQQWMGRGFLGGGGGAGTGYYEASLQHF